MFHTLTSLPEDWLCDAEGMLQPHSYVDWKSVEALFRTPRAFIAFMSQKKDIESAIDRECTSLSAMHKASETEGKRRRSAMPYGMCQPSQKPVWNKESLSPGNYGRTGEPTHCQFWAVSLCLTRISLSPSLAKPADDYSFRPLMSDRENKRIIKHHSFVFTAEPCPRFLRIAFSPTLNWMP